ncbi:hypothetical protein [Schinkia azotoformans]|uniref:hypothetical protein n=1 Tax=Schinkia azotoformans TaxID=1454 RepID=UPI002DBDA26F|nr:hypothetical protein [Schinkia azotoformans]MEC1772461.1 hypothetical protein [Schinkia azotoformans]MED4368373.1 hypothetical protein [Schinkia azotoformans]
MIISHPDREFKPKFVYYFHVENGLAAYDSEEKLEVGSIIIVDGLGTYSLKITRIWTAEEKEFIEYESFKTIVCRPKFLPLEEIQRTFKYPKTSYFEKGKEEGIKEGIEVGKEEGLREAIKEIARNLINEGIDLEIISEITQLSKDELEKI